MRPIRRNASPRDGDFDDYTAAKPYLISRLGSYCSYCERRIVSQLAVEHIQPKGRSQYGHLKGRWDNFLLSCINCNATKKDKDVDPEEVLLPDRDNTFLAFEYTPDGRVAVRDDLDSAAKSAAKRLLELVGLDRRISKASDENGRLIAMDRVSQRMEAWLLAQETKKDVESNPENSAVRECAARTARENGFFSIWMTVFTGDVDMQRRLLHAFEGTSESGCFDENTLAPISPAPNPDGLPHGGKI